MNLKRKLLDLLFIVVLGTASVALLKGAQSFSAPAVARYQRMRLKTTILTAASIPWTRADYDSAFAARIRPVGEEAGGYYRSDSLIVIEFKGRGLWGMIEGVIAVDSSITRIHRVKVMAQEETPGLGDRIADDEYLAGYAGKSATEPLLLAVRRTASGDRDVDAISGATISSQALLDVVNATLARLRQAAKGGGQ
jgi:Na+-transporting NADH:ubiquinone oxidoreductase subunit NqrC